MNPIWRAYWIWLIGIVCGGVFALFWHSHPTLVMGLGAAGLLVAQIVQSCESKDEP